MNTTYCLGKGNCSKQRILNDLVISILNFKFSIYLKNEWNFEIWNLFTLYFKSKYGGK